MSKIIAIISVFIFSNSILHAQEGPPIELHNKIITWDAVKPITLEDYIPGSDISDVKKSTQFFDGLGRPLQTVVKQGSPLGKDIISFNIYDNLGREAQMFLPYVSTTNTGDIITGPLANQQTFYDNFLTGQDENNYYSKTVFEASPENRPVLSMPPGVNWAGSNRGVKIDYFNNTDLDQVYIGEVKNEVLGSFCDYSFKNTYSPGTLFKTITRDESGAQVIEFKNKSGQVVLKKVQLTASDDDGSGANYDGWLCTYYVYDDIGNLRAVFPPKAIEVIASLGWDINPQVLDELCFRYEYDERNRMIKKQVPGAKPVSMIYDAKDRLVLTQDGYMLNKGVWMYIVYDKLNRSIETGLWTNNQDWLDHYSHSYNANTYPNFTGQSQNCEILTETYYDTYGWLTHITNTPFSATINEDDINEFSSSYSDWPYPLEIIQSSALLGMQTGSRTKILGTDNYLYSINYYDIKGRLIQQQSTDINGGKLISTTQYSFSGQPLMNIVRKLKTNSADPFLVYTKMNYDDGGRLTAVQKRIVDENGFRNDWKTISTMSYNELGQLKEKKLGISVVGCPANSPSTCTGTTTALTSLRYDYNIRGWLLSVNRTYLNALKMDDYFGFELGYDKQRTSIGDVNYATQLYNGNISGTIWKLKGDGVTRKYDFGYDNANRLLKADYLQRDYGGTSWSNDYINYDVKMGDGIDPLTAYDANGNIKRMQQWGYKIGTAPATPIDDLAYEYMNNGVSNKLKNVTDSYSDPVTKLGDFKDGTNTTADDYNYDDNGNLITDLNKNIDKIDYNHLNLPELITFPSGSIKYIYDATGNKLEKIVQETGLPAKTTTYISGFVYENNVLEFLGHEEGRVRYNPDATTAETAYLFDYFLKDHLGNVRMVLTEEQKTDIYPAATMEDGAVATEDNYYSISNSAGTIVNTPLAIANSNPDQNYENNNGIANPNPQSTPAATSEKMYKLSGTGSGGPKIGLGITLKVMAGDKLNIFGKSYYNNSTGSNLSNTSVPILDLLAGLLGSPGAAASTASHGAVTAGTINSTEMTNSITAMLQNQNTESAANPTVPSAYINYIFFDEQFKYVTCGFSRVGTSEVVKDHYSFNNVFHDIPVTKNGFVYIYCSNQSPVDVFFDNLQVVHARGPILEETSYYPFGLAMAGISSKAAGSLVNHKKFNGKEEQSHEFSDGSGLEWMDFGARMLDNQIGRWMVIDPKLDETENFSPYAFVQDNPILRFDPDGMKDSTFNPKKDKPITKKPGTETPIKVIGRDKNGNPIVDAKSKNAYNCHSYAWEKGKGDPKDPKNKEVVQAGITKWDNDPSNNIKSEKAKQLSPTTNNIPGDIVIYYVDGNTDGKYENGEEIVHSAVVKQVDKNGNTIVVTGKMGQDAIAENHPDAPGYYKNDGAPNYNPTSRAYFRVPAATAPRAVKP